MTEFTDEDIEDAMCCASAQLGDFWAELPPEDRTKQEISCFITFVMAECLLWENEDKWEVFGEILDGEGGDERRAKLKFDEWQLQKIYPMMDAFLKDRRVVEFINRKFKEVA